ncbi:hypothetical protein Acr_00g0053700 [Actinidia rufa]|uniref:Uncharacterized protein n=1 Tax=Actinidia rufa TaxID=165716 RepID=A0A7J0DLK1_9ERIC|nr:hypothetical protein Acr_00g0053700 [Actinidia rufa]
MFKYVCMMTLGVRSGGTLYKPDTPKKIIFRKLIRRAIEGTEKEVVELKEKELLAKKLVIEEYKSSDDFQEVVEQVASRYFGEGFDLCKKQISRLHTDLDLKDMGIDAELAQKEKRKRKRKRKRKKSMVRRRRKKARRRGELNNDSLPEVNSYPQVYEVAK